MKVVGFSFIRNAVKFDYPIVESITSILPICDEFIIALGNSDDNTEDLIKSIDSNKIRIIHTTWDDSLRKGGKVLAVETNKAFNQIKEADWAFYIQGDEVIHEKYLPIIKESMEKWKDDQKVEGLLLNYTHFYGSYDFVGDSRRWYRREIRIVRADKNISSYKDAQGFRKNERKLNVKHINAWVYHYGWVKPPFEQQEKQKYFNTLWHDEDWIKKNVKQINQFDYSTIDSLSLFEGTHPMVMQERISKLNWKFDFDPTKKNFGLKTKLLHWIEKISGWRIGEYKNYKII
ncbi:MAG: glycosyltransferase family 2 protein [Bacteroidia bacterium]|nr:glycosyltransferase family 2 protein [Bacteroidia bacterium]